MDDFVPAGWGLGRSLTTVLCLSTTTNHQPTDRPTNQVALRSWPTEPYGKGNYFKWSPDDKFVAIGKVGPSVRPSLHSLWV